MTDNISGAGGSNTDVTTGADAASAPASAGGAEQGEEAGLEALNAYVGAKIQDAWEEGAAVTDDFEEFVAANSKDGTLKSALRQKGKSVLDMMAERSKKSSKAQAASTSASDDPALERFDAVLASASNDLADMSRAELVGLIKDGAIGSDFEERLQFAAHLRPESRKALAAQITRTLTQRGDIPKDEIAALQDQILEATEDAVLHTYEDQFIAYTTNVMDEAQSTIQDKFNADSSARREVLASFAEKSGDADQIEQMMASTLSIPRSDAAAIAEQLAKLNGHPDKIAELRSGKAGPETWGGLGDGEYLNLEQDLEAALDDAASDMGVLVTRLKNDRLVGTTKDDHRILADENFKLAHKLFMNKLGPEEIGMVDAEAMEGLQAIFEDEKAQAKEVLEDEGWTRKGVMIVAAIGVSVATGGAAAPAAVGIATGAASSTPDVIQAWHTADLAQQAHAQGQTDEATAEAAKNARNKAIASTIAGLVAPQVKLSKPAYRELYEEFGEAAVNGLIGWASSEAVGLVFDG